MKRTNRHHRRQPIFHRINPSKCLFGGIETPSQKECISKVFGHNPVLADRLIAYVECESPDEFMAKTGMRRNYTHHLKTSIISYLNAMLNTAYGLSQCKNSIHFFENLWRELPTIYLDFTLLYV